MKRPSGIRRRLCRRLRRSSSRLRRGLKLSARSTYCSTESSGVASEVNAAILRTPSERISGPTSIMTSPASRRLCCAGPRQPVDAAQRHPHQHEALELQRVDERADVAGVALGGVVHLGRPLALAVAALVQGQAVPLPAERGAHDVPRVGVETAAVQEDHGRQALDPPVEIVEAHGAEQQVMRVGQREIGQRHAGGGRRQLQVRAELVRAEAHAASR